jgi:hypothetical protein
MGLFLRVLDFVFGCHHSNLSKVFTIDCRTYRVCFGCGSTFDYSLETMSMAHHVHAPAPVLTSLRINLNQADKKSRRSSAALLNGLEGKVK